MKTILKKVNNYIEKSLLNYIDKVTKTLYPKPHLKEEEDDNEPTLFT